MRKRNGKTSGPTVEWMVDHIRGYLARDCTLDDFYQPIPGLLKLYRPYYESGKDVAYLPAYFWENAWVLCNEVFLGSRTERTLRTFLKAWLKNLELGQEAWQARVERGEEPWKAAV